MLTLALAATLVGFVLLVLGLITGTVWLAISCIVVCLAGLGFLIADVVGKGRRDDEDEPTLADFVDADRLEDGTRQSSTESGGARADRFDGRADTPATRAMPAGPTPDHGPTVGRAGGGSQPDVPPPGVGRHGRDPEPPPRPHRAAEAPSRDSSYDDYLRSVGGYPAPHSGPARPRRDDAATEAFPSGGAESPPPPPPAQSEPTRDAERSEANPVPEQRRQRFDPLDPNWHPPLD